jgi:TrmH family RNA methyltransferase
LFQIQITGFGTFMDGLNIYKAILPREGIIIMGNEAVSRRFGKAD